MGLEGPSSPLDLTEAWHDVPFLDWLHSLSLINVYDCRMKKTHPSSWGNFLIFQKGHGNPTDRRPWLWHATNDTGAASEWLMAPSAAGRGGRNNCSKFQPLAKATKWDKFKQVPATLLSISSWCPPLWGLCPTTSKSTSGFHWVIHIWFLLM